MTYDAFCSACDFGGEIEKPMADEFPTRCPSCGKDALAQDYAKKRVILQDLSPKTFGQQSDLNRKAMGKEQCQIKDDAAKPKTADLPWWRDGQTKPLDVSTVRDVDHYIQTGEK